MSRSNRPRRLSVNYNKESGVARRLSMKAWKAKCRAMMQKRCYDAFPVKKGTEGWITW